MTESVLDAAGRRRSPATMPGYHGGRPPRNKGVRYPADPPTVDEIVAVMRRAANDRHGFGLRGVIVVLWRAGLRIQEALSLGEHDLDARRGSILVRNGKGGRRREVGMDEWGWEQLRPLADGPRQTPGRAAVLHHRRPDARATVVRRRRPKFRRVAAQAGVRRRFAPHQLATRMRLSSPARACRSTSSSASSDTPISALPRSTCRGSTPRRSSRRCARAVRR
jgi:integrase